MRKWIAILLFLACCGPLGAALADDAYPVLPEDRRMLLEGRDIFSYTSAELYALWEARGLTAGEICPLGFGDGYDGKCLALFLPFDGFQVWVMTIDPDAVADRSRWDGATYAEVARQTVYPVASVRVNEPDIPGPLGVKVGMTADELAAKTLDFLPWSVRLSDDGGFTEYTLRYQDTAPDQAPFELRVLIDQGVIREYTVLLDWADEFL